MISKEQKIEMLNNLSKILSVIKECRTIKEISYKTKIPTSTIQRYLQRKDLLTELLENPNETSEFIQDWLKKAKQYGLKEGGRKSQEKYGYTKNEQGEFNGNRKSSSKRGG